MTQTNFKDKQIIKGYYSPCHNRPIYFAKKIRGYKCSECHNELDEALFHRLEARVSENA
jgi:uncharacterized protein YlaI